MTKDHYLGIDGGGTKTEAVLLDAQGQEIARAVGGPSNYHTVRRETAETSLREVIGRVLTVADLAMADVTAICLGMAGVARPDDHKVVQAIASRIAPCPRVIITHDAEAALVGGVGRRYGTVLIAGTGAIAYGVDAQGESRRADGWGYLLGDEGSAYWIGREGLRAVARAHDSRGPTTELEDLLLAHLGLADASELVKRVYASDFGVPQVAGLAPLVSRSALTGDAIAREILQQAGQRLTNTLGAVIRSLGMTGEAFEAVLTGGLFRTQGLLWDTIVAAIDGIAPRAQIIEPRHDAAYGAALIAKQAGE